MVLWPEVVVVVAEPVLGHDLGVVEALGQGGVDGLFVLEVGYFLCAHAGGQKNDYRQKNEIIFR